MSGVTVPTMMTSTSVGCDAARRQALLRRLRAHVAHALSLGQHVPLADAGALHDPLVVGVYHFFEVLIGQNIGGNVGSERGNLGAPAHHGANGEGQCISPCANLIAVTLTSRPAPRVRRPAGSPSITDP